MDAFVVDWQRRRVLQAASAYPTHCHHGVKLVRWCPDCEVDLDAIMADFSQPESA